MKKQKKEEKSESEKKFSPKENHEDDFDDLSEKAYAGDVRSMMLLLAKHGNRGYELKDSELDDLIGTNFKS